MITRAIETCLQTARERKWEKTYWAFDIHGTILKPNYKRDEISKEFYPHAKEVLQLIGKQKSICKILYTCSYPHEIEQYLAYFAQHGIHFDYINRNPEIGDGAYGYYQHKFYFNILFDDKAGFDGEADWLAIKKILQSNF